MSAAKQSSRLATIFARAKSDREIKHYFEKLLACVELPALKLEGSKYERQDNEEINDKRKLCPFQRLTDAGEDQDPAWRHHCKIPNS